MEHILSNLTMSNAGNYILIDADTGMSSSYETQTVFNGDQNNSPDIDELQQLLGDSFTSEVDDPETMISAEYGSSSAEDEHPVSALEELEELYGVSGEAEADDSSTGDVSDAASLMAEMEELYGNSIGTEIDNAETIAEIEEFPDEDTAESAALMEELEELFGSSTESADTDLSSQVSEQSSTEEDTSSMSALDELRAFLGEDTQAEAGDNEASSVSALESSFVNRRSVLDELQNLLQSCLDKLKADELNADANSAIGDIHIFADAEYPSRDELQNILETTLSQLMLFSGSTAATISTDSVSVLDELKNFMHETGAADKAETSDSLFMADGFDEPEESDAGEYDVYYTSEDVAAKDKGADSIIDELNLLLSDSETSDSALESDYSKSDISDESPVLDELAAYMAELSDDTDIDAKASVDDTDVGSIDAESARASNTLEELEVMLNEIGIYDIGKTDGSIKASEEDFSYENETGQPSADNRKDTVEDNCDLYGKVKTAKVVTDKAAENTSVEDVNLLDEQDNNNRVPVAGLLLSTVLAVGFYAFWSPLDSGGGVDDRSETAQSKRVEKSSVVYEKIKASAWSEQSAAQNSTAQMQESEYGFEDEYLHGLMAEENSGAGITVVADTVYKYEPLEDIEINSSEPISSYEDNSLTVETAGPGVDIKAVQVERIDDVQTTVKDIVKETISLDVKNLLQENKENIEQLQRRMTEAESSITKLQEEKTGKADDIIEPVQPVISEQVENHGQADKAGFTEPPDLVAPPVIRVQGKDGYLWSVQLSSYYGKPPPASELKYLEKAGISYEIKKAMVNEKVWFRVIVDEFSEYEKAKQFSDDIIKNVIRKKVIKKNVIRKDMWINKGQ